MKIVTNSESRTWRRCRRKWWLTYVRRLQYNWPDFHGARALGTRIHRAIGGAYPIGGAFDLETAYRILVEDYAADQAAINEAYDATPERTGRDDALAGLAKDYDLAVIMVEGYAEWLEESAADAALEVLAIEEEVIVPSFVPESALGPIALGGKLDKRFRRIDSGFMGFLDFKTVGNLSDLPKTAAQNEQGLTYSVLLRLVHGEHVDGEIIRMLRKVKRTKTAKPPFFGEHQVRWNSDQLNNYVARLHGIIRELAAIEAALAAGADPQVMAYPNPTGDCSWDCDFSAICPMFDDGSRVEDALRMHYHEGDPNARYTVITSTTEERK